ncbi:MAG: glycosyltransferase family 2 protein [Methanobrevibacter boviskoreani]|jgi:glycosyltransferase involved in cell wall biosynthesis|uniref:glycosyltransferase family 2 protein n=1 Tax=Methanobrevibacter TaxID=2172 RepID=UPI00033485AD|nr:MULTISPECIES: glycosyltransferase family 2 protein [Methanobrevibacter]AGN16630.1 glycosyl transferase GT2 family [Methanobrevibacter sp. AbM4]MCI6774736.1 glycosyltransferase family 2 protein [Methanobrevibacter boviskoreani]MCI6930585.1 glycosyltransferase family 2 protein [Methanobrevibacter boviskoreani]MDY5614720.1 glycosyltransferase family 2 protein [Methanobrevibacter boviskoreani]
MVRIIALIPAFNEEVALGSVILRTLQYVDDVLIVDDGSTDATNQIARLAGAKVITHPNNLGKGEGLKSGFQAIGDDYDIILTIDGDGQHNPDEIPLLLKPILDGEADLVNGSRYINGPEENTPAYRRVGQQVLDKATNISAGIDVTDSQSGFRAFSSKCCSCFRFKDTGFGIESEMLVDAAENGYRIMEVPITVRYDVDGSTKDPVTHGVGVLLNIIKDKIQRTFNGNK